MDRYLTETPMPDFPAPAIQALIGQHGFGIPCRVHGFTIAKKLQKGAMTRLVYALAPAHSAATV